jgi:4-hydroxy-4-methyl-2-oxoglutarate aldolase
MDERDLPEWLDSTVAADAAGAASALPPSVAPLRPDQRAIGRAQTALASLDDNGVIATVLDLPADGDVLVVAGAAWSRTAVVGDLMARELYLKGYRALVTDGPVRDGGELAKLPFTVWSRSTTTPASGKAHRGHVGVPVSIGGVTVCAGDLIIADGGGVVVWPADEVDALLAKAMAKHDADEARLEGLIGRSPASPS